MEDLTSTIYKDLRKMAASQMSGESHPQTLQATALVHEAWLRVGGDKQPDWANRAHFFGAAAEAMRRILVERARKRRALRHGGGMMRADADPDSEDFAEAIADPADDKALLLLHEALDELSAGDNQTADLVKLHYFAGLTIQEAAEVLGLSKRTAERRLTFARTWLVNQLKQE